MISHVPSFRVIAYKFRELIKRTHRQPKRQTVGNSYRGKSRGQLTSEVITHFFWGEKYGKFFSDKERNPVQADREIYIHTQQI